MKECIERVQLAVCDRCRAQGGCILGFPARWEYKTTQPDPQTGWRVTKMNILTRPVKGNGFNPPVEAFATNGGRTIVGCSMCAYVRSQKFKSGQKKGAPDVPENTAEPSGSQEPPGDLGRAPTTPPPPTLPPPPTPPMPP